MSRTALITGVTGFIGQRLARRLLGEGWTVHALLRGAPPTKMPGLITHHYAGRMEDVVNAVVAGSPDVTFHLASLYLADHRPEQVGDLVASNVLLTAQLAEALSISVDCRLINTGTAWQHHRGATYLPVNLYAATKQAGADLLRYYADGRGLSVITLKLFDTYGPGDTRRKLVQLLVEAAVSGRRLDMSPGEQRVDLTHVDDVVQAYVLAAELLCATATIEETFFVGGDRLSVRELADRVASALARPVDARFGGRPYRAREVMEPVAAVPLLPGWRPATSLSDGIRALADSGFG